MARPHGDLLDSEAVVQASRFLRTKPYERGVGPELVSAICKTLKAIPNEGSNC